VPAYYAVIRPDLHNPDTNHNHNPDLRASKPKNGTLGIVHGNFGFSIHFCL